MKQDHTRAYKSELKAPLLKDDYLKLPNDTFVLIVKIQNAKGILVRYVAAAFDS
jgi:hypothetical protein